MSPKIKCKNSGMHGLGTFAVKNVKKGEILAVLGGVIVPTSKIKKYRKKLGHVGIQISDNFFICPTSREELPKGVFNHSCDPNVGLIDPITYVAIKNIIKGEEIVIDYAFCETVSTNDKKIFFKCNCKSKICRKLIKVDDWKRKDLQKKYGKYFSPYIKRKFQL